MRDILETYDRIACEPLADPHAATCEDDDVVFRAMVRQFDGDTALAQPRFAEHALGEPGGYFARDPLEIDASEMATILVPSPDGSELVEVKVTGDDIDDEILPVITPGESF